MTTRLSDAGRTRAGLAAGAVLLAITGMLAGCSSDDGGDEPIEDTQTESESPDEQGDGDGGDAAAEAEVEDVYLAYWDAVIELENGDELDRSLFDGIATTGLVESEVGRVSAFKDNGVHRSGAPVIEDTVITVDGDTARIESCKSEADWSVIDENGEVIPDAVPENLKQPHPFVATAERADGEWLINATLPTEGATITC